MKKIAVATDANKRCFHTRLAPAPSWLSTESRTQGSSHAPRAGSFGDPGLAFLKNQGTVAPRTMLSPCPGPAGCVQPSRSNSSSRLWRRASVRERLKPLKSLLRGNLPGILKLQTLQDNLARKRVIGRAGRERGRSLSVRSPQGAGRKAGSELTVQGLGLQQLPQRRGMLPEPCRLQPRGRAVNPLGSSLLAEGKLGEGGRKRNLEGVFKLLLQPFPQQKPLQSQGARPLACSQG